MTANFNVEDFLFNEPQKHQEFDFINFWNTELMSNNTQSCDTQHEMKSELSNFIGDITPAAAAVAAVEQSPFMETPLLDNSCMNTPFTPMLFTPQLSHYTPSANIHQAMDGLISTVDTQLDDVNIANYLKNDTPWQDNSNVAATIPGTPAITTDYLFGTLDSSVNVSPSDLLLNNANSTDTLFPPITSNQQQQNFSLDQATELLNNTDDLFIDTFDDLFQLNNETIPAAPVISNNKRKNHDDASFNIKRVKLIQKSDKDEKRFECEICHAKFSRKYNLGTHVKTHNKNRNKDFSCTTCNKSFDRKHDLTRHISTVHNGERAFACSECSSHFSRKDALVRHRIQKHHYES